MTDEETLMEAFAEKIDFDGPDGCWVWTAGVNSLGYGCFRVGPSLMLAHRIIYEMERGPIPPGMIVRHKCDNPACCNPDHLEVGTHADNVADRVSRGRSARGSGNGRAKLTEDLALQILASKETNQAIAKRLGVSPDTVRKIRSRVLWKHLSMGRVWEKRLHWEGVSH